MVLWCGRMISVPEEDQRSEIRLGRKLEGWRKEVEMQGAGTRELVVYEWVVEQQLLETFLLSRDPQQGAARSAD